MHADLYSRCAILCGTAEDLLPGALANAHFWVTHAEFDMLCVA